MESAGRATRTVVVTGASSGIGAATAVELGRLGWTVALGARRRERLEEVAKRVEEAGGRAFVHPLDVAEPGSIDAFWDAAAGALGEVDVLVSNAGANRIGLLDEVGPDDVLHDVAVNLSGALLLARRAVPAMRARRRGDLLFVTSENAVRPRPHQVAYTAAKAGLEAAARALEMELEGTGVRSMVVRVGPTGSEFGSAMDPARLHRALAAWKYWGVQRHLHWMPSESVARTIRRLLTTPAEESYPTVTEVMPGGRSKAHRDTPA